MAGHCVTCAAGLASVTEILDNNLSENAKEMGEYMKQELAKLPHVKEARGRGTAGSDANMIFRSL